MTTVAFDTLKPARRLEAAGFAPRQAQDAAEAISDAIVETVATRTDLGAPELSLRSQVEQAKAQLEIRIADAKSEVLRWMFGAIGLQTLAILGGVIAIRRLGTS